VTELPAYSRYTS